ncbi:hypothetical protein F8M41_002769 [Gigaspora margarita]|uniref:Uncharacterized protein n=1 Tax=Gigaspora margarita TaxID=4874 RepID=A0A8H3XET0_GIGMA|nr:hypothetical protein F8M41_002769 [Gigaspora margarita]
MVIGSAYITDFFDKDNSDQDDESSEGSSLNESHQILESKESDLDNERCQDAEIIEYKDVKNIKDAIKRTENLIQNENPQKIELAWYQSVVEYLHLLQTGKKKEIQIKLLL